MVYGKLHKITPMKKIVLIFFILSASNGLVAQSSYISFPNPAYWRVDASDNDVGPPACSGYYYYHYETGSDTVINSDIYVKIIRSPFAVSGSNPCYYADVAPGYVGALRDDSVANKVFFIYQSQTTDSLLFDYNINVGDTVKGILAPLFTYAFVTSIDSVLIDSQYHKRWNLDYCSGYSFYFIEGIGSNLGLIEGFGCGAGIVSYLICVMDSSGSIYSGSSSSLGCQLINSINDIYSEKDIIKISPNPSSSEINISLEGEDLNDYEISITNILGEIQKTKIENSKISVEAFSSGLYFITAIKENKRFACKFIKD